MLPLKVQFEGLQRLSTLSFDLVIGGQGAVKQPAFLDLRNVSDKGLVAGLKDLVKDNPIGLPVLQSVRVARV